MSVFLKLGIRLKGGMLAAEFDRAAQDPRKYQEKLLFRILKDNKNTLYGKKYGFGGIKSVEEYRRRVPVVKYAEIEGYIERMMLGEKDVLTSLPLAMYNRTSGTTNKSKSVPMSRTMYKTTVDMAVQWLYRAIRENPGMIDGKNFGIANMAVEGMTPSGVPYGYSSGMVRKSASSFLGDINSVPIEVSDISDYDLKYYLLMRFGLEQNVTFAVTPVPMTLVNAAKAGIRHQEEIIASMRAGVVMRPGYLIPEGRDAEITRGLAGRMKPNPGRADELEKVLKEEGRLLPWKCWPGFRLIGCWTASSMGMQLPLLDEYFGPDAVKRDIGYVASEAACSIPFMNATPGAALAVLNNYYEFVPEDAAGDDNPRILGAHELKEGGNYKILLTNTSGLYRYDICDVIKVTGSYKKTPVIAFERKSDDFLNITGEKMHVNHFMQAFRRAGEKSGIKAAAFRVVPEIAAKRFGVYISFAAGPDRAEKEFLPLVDGFLCEENNEYRYGRDHGFLEAPRFVLMAQEWEAEVRKKFILRNGNDVQYKWKHVVVEPAPEDAEYVLKQMQ